ncbi:MAG: sensor histidine kinase [Sphingobacteriales bacterium]|nr:sensor histidine kinase [Sphingobacteriales bacterium]
MKKLSAILLYVAFAVTAFCQNKSIDSLRSVIAANPGDVKVLANNYAELCQEYRRYNTDSAKEYGRKAIDIATQNKLTRELGKAYCNLGNIYEATGKIDDGFLLADSALKFSTLAKDYKGQCLAENLYGVLNRRKAKYAEAMAHHINAYKIAEANNNKQLMATALSGCASVQMTIKDIDKAEDFQLQALQLRKENGTPREIAQSYTSLGIANRERRQYDKALNYYFKAFDELKKLGDSSGISFSYNDIGAAYSFKGNTAEAEKYLKESIAIRERIHELNELAYTYNYLGENYERKNDFINAEVNIKKALSIAKEINNSKQTYEALESLSDFYSRHNRYDSAYKYLQSYKSYRDSIAKKDKAEVVAELTAKYETTKKEKQIQEQQFELARKNYWIIGGTVLFSLIVLLGYSLYRRNVMKQEARLQAEILKQQDIATKAILEAEEKERQRIAKDLHDGVGQMMSAAKLNLSAIENEIPFKDDMQKEAVLRIIKLVDDSCKEVRAVSHNMMPNALLKAGLSSAIREFINQIDQKIIKVTLHSEGLNERLDSNTEIVLYRVIQECVNNVIKHAGATQLDISLIRDEDGISATIEDNGKGFDTTDTSKSSGLGLKNIQARVEYLKGTVDFDSAPGKGTLVAIHVPLTAA